MGLKKWVRRSTRGVEDFTRGAEGHENRREYVYKTIDCNPFQVWVVFVAGFGFLTDAYDIFALNVIIPMLGYVYYPDQGRLPTSIYVSLLAASLAGTVIGQLLFGFLGDRLGRRRMYGYELVLVICATIGVAMSSTGASNSMSVFGWLIFWRLMMGIAIGSDYPLSAVITSEFAPRKHRLRMLAVVFFKQPLGQMLAVVVSIIVVRSSKGGIPSTFNLCSVTGSPAGFDADLCLRSVDRAWRWVAGLGAVPAVFAIAFRFTIPESPRYLMDVLGRTREAAQDTSNFYEAQADLRIEVEMEQGRENLLKSGPREPMSPRQLLQRQDDRLRPDSRLRTEERPMYGEVSPHASVNLSMDDTIAPARLSLGQDGNVRPSSMLAPDERPSHDDGTPLAQANYSIDDASSRVLAAGEDEDRQLPPEASWADARDYFWTQGNWRYLLGTSLSWALLDLPFYGLGLSNSTITRTIWYSNPEEAPTSVYDMLFENVEHQLAIVIAGAVVGGAIFIKVIKWLPPKTIQFYGFLVLGALMLITGSAFDSLLGSGLIILYILCLLFFNLGANPTTFIIPAELFPTRYRCTCHGIAAASGKIGSTVAQLFLAYVHFGRYSETNEPQKWLGHVLQVLCVFMVAGAATTWFLVPNTVDAKGQSRSLEVLAQGRRRLLELGNATAPEDGDYR